MPLFPKKHFEWKEPKPFRQLNDAYQRSRAKWWYQPLGLLVITALTMGQWAFMRFVLHKNQHSPGSALVVSLCFGALLTYVLPWLMARIEVESQIAMTDKKMRMFRGTVVWVDYSSFVSFEWRVNDDFATLIFHWRNGKGPVPVGVPLDISREAISQFLIEKGIAPAQ